MLKSRKEAILSGLKWCKGRSDATREQFNKECTNKQAYKDFVCNQSIQTGIAEPLYSSLLDSVLSNLSKNDRWGHISPQLFYQSSNGHVDPEKLADLSFVIQKYYLIEREMTLLVMTGLLNGDFAVFRAGEIPVVDEIRKQLLSASSKYSRDIVVDFELNTPIPGEIESTPRLEHLWAYHLHRERRALLELIFTIVSESEDIINEWGMETAKKVLSGAEISFGGLSAPLSVGLSIRNLRERIDNLTVMIAIACMNVVSLSSDGVDNVRKVAKLPISSSVGKFIEFQKLLEDKFVSLFRLDARVRALYGPVQLAWGLTLNVLIPKLSVDRPVTYMPFLDMMKRPQEPKDARKEDGYGTSAGAKDPFLLIKSSCINCAAHTHILSMLRCMDMHETPALRSRAKLLVKSLMMLLLDAVNYSLEFPYFETFLDIFHRTMDECPQAGIEWWKCDYELHSRRSIIECAISLYPLYLSFLTNIIKSMTSTASSTYNCYLLLKSVDSFSVNTEGRESYYEELIGLPGSSGSVSFGKSVVLGANNFQLIPPEHSKVQILDKVVVFPEWKHSAWHYFLSELDAFTTFFRLSVGGALQGSIGSKFEDRKLEDRVVAYIGVAKSIIDAISSVVQNLGEGNHINDFSAHIADHPGASQAFTNDRGALAWIYSIIVDIADVIVINRSIYCDELFASCAKALRCMLLYVGDDAWTILCSSKFAPHRTTPHYSSINYVVDILTTRESVSGDYATTLEYLKLVDSLVESSQRIKITSAGEEVNNLSDKKIYVVKCLLEYVLFNILPGTESRRYKLLYNMLDLVDHAVRVLNRVVDDATWDPYLHKHTSFPENSTSLFCGKSCSEAASRKYGNVQSLVLNVFFSGSSSGQVIPLLRTVAITSEGLKNVDSLCDPDLIHKMVDVSSGILGLLNTILTKRSEQSLPLSGIEKHAFLTNLIPDEQHCINFIQVLENFLLCDYSMQLSLLGLDILGILLFQRSHKPTRDSSSSLHRCVGPSLSRTAQLVANMSKYQSKTGIIRADKFFISYGSAILDFLVAAVREDPFMVYILFECEHTSHKNGATHGPLALKVSSSSKLCPLIAYAADTVIGYSNPDSDVDPVLAVSAMRSLDSIWQNETAYSDILSRLRKTPGLLAALSNIIDTVYDDEKKFDRKNVGSVLCSEVKSYCSRIFTRVFALRILAIELHIMYSSKDHGDSKERTNILRTIVEKSRQQCKYGGSFASHRSVLSDFNELLKLYKELGKYPFMKACELECIRIPAHPWVYNRTRDFGDYYYHDTGLLRKKLTGAHAESVVSISKYVNRRKSLIDAHWNQFKAWDLIIDVIVATNVDSDPLRLRRLGISKEWAYDLIIDLAKGVAKESHTDYYTVSYLSDVCRTIKTLVLFWIDRLGVELPIYFSNPDRHCSLPGAASEHGKMSSSVTLALQNAAIMLDHLSNCLKVSTYNLGPSGVISEYDFHRSIFSTILKIISAFNSNILSQSSKLSKPLMKIMPAAYLALSFVLKGLSVDISSCNISDAIFILTLTSEIVPSNEGSQSEEFWLRVIDKYDIVENILLALCNIVGLSSQDNTELINALLENILSSSIVPLFSKKIQDANMWKIFCKGSILRIHGNNMNASVDIPVDPAIHSYESKKPKDIRKHTECTPSTVPIGVRDSLYSVWCNVLSISSLLVYNWGYLPEYLSKAMFLLSLYEDQIIGALGQAIKLPDMSTDFLLRSVRQEHDVVLRNLKKHNPSELVLQEKDILDEGRLAGPITEIDKITTLFLCFAKWVYNDEASTFGRSTALSVYEGYALRILNSLIILFESPNELYLRICMDAARSRPPINGDSAPGGRINDMASCGTEAAKQDLIEDMTKRSAATVRTMIKVAQTILLHFVISCRAMKIMSIVNLRRFKALPRNVFHPTTSVHTNLHGATLGCLFDLARALSKFINYSAGSTESDFFKPSAEGAPAGAAHPPALTKAKVYPALFYFSLSSYPIKELLSITEKALAIATTQIALYKYNSSISQDRKSEDLKELTSELRSTIKMFEDSVKTLDRSNYAKKNNINAEEFSGACRSALDFTRVIDAFRSREVSDS